jgi:GTP-binding protein Era
MTVRKRKKHHSGFVSILGRPNAGKSTLINALVGSKVAIVADKPQTTRNAIQGVWSDDDAQVVFLDTPGIHAGESLINQRMMDAVQEGLDARDLLLFVADATKPFDPVQDAAAVQLTQRAATPTILLLNKVDRVEDKAKLLALIEHYRQLLDFQEYIPISALTGDGLDRLRTAILERMPVGPEYFPKDYITDQPERFLLTEIIREKILAITRQEVPHSVAVLVDQWEETARLTRVAVTIYVERPGQKVIIVGTKGARLKQVGTEAREELESLLGRKLFLSIFVKVQPGWRENAAFLRELDWRTMLTGDKKPVPDDNKE